MITLRKILKGIATITINGTSYQSNNISIKNSKIVINGKDVTPNEKQISIVVTGNITTLDVESCETIKITGDVTTVKTMSGNVNCGNVKDNAKTMSGDIMVTGNVGGNAESTSGDINCGNITGNVKTMSGDIKYKK